MTLIHVPKLNESIGLDSYIDTTRFNVYKRYRVDDHEKPFTIHQPTSRILYFHSTNNWIYWIIFYYDECDRVVSYTKQALVYSSRLGIRSGMDDSLHPYGCCMVVCSSEWN